jgi:hypothetical protein
VLEVGNISVGMFGNAATEDPNTNNETTATAIKRMKCNEK